MIHDKYTDLEVSRQRKHQLRKRDLGLCQICTRARVNATYCEAHTPWKAAYNLKSYRKRKKR